MATIHNDDLPRTAVSCAASETLHKRSPGRKLGYEGMGRNIDSSLNDLSCNHNPVCSRYTVLPSQEFRHPLSPFGTTETRVDKIDICRKLLQGFAKCGCTFDSVRNN